MTYQCKSSRLELGAGNTETLAPSSAAGINPSCGKVLNVAGAPRNYYDGALDRNTAQPCTLVRNLEKPGECFPILLTRLLNTLRQ